MDARQKAKRLSSRRAIVGWLAIGKLIWDRIDELSTLDWVVSKMSMIGDFLSSPYGNLVLLVLGFGFIAWAILRPETKQHPKFKKVAGMEQISVEEQEGHEEQWLHPVIEWIDLNRVNMPADRIMVKYQIDSGLVFDFKPYRIWVKPIIGGYEPREGYEIIPPPNILKGKRTQLASHEIYITDERLLDRINLCRKGGQMEQTLKIVVQLRDGEEPKVLEPMYSIRPFS